MASGQLSDYLMSIDQTTEIQVDPETNTLMREGVESQINAFDLCALAEAAGVQMAEQAKQQALEVIIPAALGVWCLRRFPVATVQSILL